MRPSFLKVATRPKWIGALFIALAAAAVCALLAQWQLGRSIRITNDPTKIATATQLSTLTKVGNPVTDALADRRTYEVVSVLPKTCSIIENRFQLQQDGTKQQGFWVMTDSIDTLGRHVWLAHGFTTERATANDVCQSQIAAKTARYPFNTEIGHYEPSEDVQPRLTGSIPTYAAVTVPQLINTETEKPAAVYSGFMVLEASGLDPRLNKIVIGIKDSQNQLNLLNAFYAIEWTLFAGFAVFMWFRLIQDERLRIEENDKARQF